jgi:hypothetical protein
MQVHLAETALTRACNSGRFRERFRWLFRRSLALVPLVLPNTREQNRRSSRAGYQPARLLSAHHRKSKTLDRRLAHIRRVRVQVIVVVIPFRRSYYRCRLACNLPPVRATGARDCTTRGTAQTFMNTFIFRLSIPAADNRKRFVGPARCATRNFVGKIVSLIVDYCCNKFSLRISMMSRDDERASVEIKRH